MSTTQSHHQLVARPVSFQWQNTPQPWIPGDAFTSHFINVLHLLLPEGELWFCRLYNQALPDITEVELKEDVKGFIRQEAIHSRSHQGVLERYFSGNNINTDRYTGRVHWLFTQVLGDAPFGWSTKNAALKRFWLTFRLGVIAAIEHFTCVIGRWILENKGLDEANADPTMMDLLRWHGAEEVEHRNVAHDLFLSRGGHYLYRISLMLLVGPMLLLLWYLGTRFFLRQEPEHQGRIRFFRQWARAAAQDRLPNARFLLLSVWRYLRPGYHPRDEADTDVALAYLAVSESVTAARQR